MARWTWDPNKAKANQRKHRLAFELATRVFEDPLSISKPDLHPDGDRWRTIGMVRQILIFVVHTLPAAGAPGRIVSARRVTAHERRAYEEGTA